MKIDKILLLFIFLISGLMFSQESYNSLLYEGNSAFKKENYEKSSSKFMEAVKSKEKDFDAHYNLGNAFYKQKKYEEARAEFGKAEKLAKNLPDKMAAQYNLGNTYMETQQLDQAAESYKKALKQDPHNEAAQRNYQIAKLKQKQKEEQKKQDGGKNGDKKNDADPEDGKGDTPKKENGKGDENIKGQGDNGTEKNKDDSEKNIPKELEKAILNRTENNERETARRILNKNANAIPQSNEKDW